MANEALASALMGYDETTRNRLGLDPNIAQRGSILPLGRTQSGELSFAVPEIAIEIAKALMLPGHAAQGGTFTPRDVTEAALETGMLGSLGTAPAGAFGIFAGRRAKTANRETLSKAEAMASRGIERGDIWAETGWFKGADGKWRFEIGDETMAVNPVEGTARRQGVSGDYSSVQHPDLAEAYPEMQDIVTALSSEGRGGSYQAGSTAGAQIFPPQLVAQGGPDALRSTGLHELQHGTQDIEGFARGGDVVEFTPVENNMLKSLEAVPYADLTKAERKVLAKLRNEEATRLDVPNPREQYRRLAGEAEARNVQARRDFTPGQRAATPPWETLDVPESELIVRMLQGGQ